MRTLRVLFTFVPLLMALCAAIPAAAQPKDNIDILFDEINQLLGSGKLAEALNAAIKTRNITEQEYGTDDRRFHRALRAVALVHMELRQFDEAEPIYQQVLAKQEQVLGPDHEDVAKTLSQFGTLRMLQGRSEEAEAYYRRALAVHDKIVSARPAEHADTLDLLGRLLAGQQRYDEAEAANLRALAIAEKAGGPAERDMIVRLKTSGQYYAYWRAIKIAEKTGGQDQSELKTLLRRFALFCTGNNLHADASKLHERVVSIVEASKDKNVDALASALIPLADAYTSERRYTEAESIIKRVQDMAERASRDGGDHYFLSTVNTRGRLLTIYEETGRYADAEPLMRQILAKSEQKVADGKTPEYRGLHSPLRELADLLVKMNKPDEAEPILRRALAMAERAGKDELLIDAIIVNNKLALGNLLFDANRFAEAETYFRQAMEEAEQNAPHLKVSAYDSLARLLSATNRPEEAEPLFQRAIALVEAPGGLRNLSIALSHYAGFLQDRLRVDEAVPLLRRALALAEQAAGAEDNLGLISPLNNLATALEGKQDYAEAEQLLRRSLSIAERGLGPDHPRVATRLSNLGRVLVRDNRAIEAIPLLQRALAIAEKGRPADHTDLAHPLSGLAEAMMYTGRLAEVEPLLRRQLAIEEKAYGPEHPETATTYFNIGLVRATIGDWAGAVDLYRRALPALTGRTGDVKIGSRLGFSKAVLEGRARPLHYLASARYHADPRGTHLDESLQVAQWARQSEAGDALAQMSARLAKADGPLAALIRNRETLVAEREAQDKHLLTAIGRAERKGIDQYRQRIVEIDADLDAIEAELETKFPDYADLANPKPLALAEIQSLLGPDEALIAFSDMSKVRTLPGETLVWVVTRDAARERSVALDSEMLADRVNTLRCGLDQALWRDEATARKCASDLSHARNPAPGLLPFDLSRAHDLYKQLLAPDEDLIKGKHLLISPSGALATLPFGVLVTQRPQSAIPTGVAEYSRTAWLGTRQPISILPSPNALKALRRVANASRAAKPYLGVGNPTLVGDASERVRAEAARKRQSCMTGMEARIAPGADRKVASFDELLRGAHADIEQIRMASPLPETADELCDVGQRLKAADSDILLGMRASETTLKAMSESGKLADYRILHFATHGVLAGKLHNTAEPGLLLTPPEKGTNAASSLERDDGFLAASEVATLNLDSDWVILSACDTAGGARDKAEALSGLARAFFYAGGRSLLVSHWAVDSHATVKLVTGALWSADGRTGCASRRGDAPVHAGPRQGGRT